MKNNRWWEKKTLDEKIEIVKRNHERQGLAVRRLEVRESPARTCDEPRQTCACNSLKTSAEEIYADWKVTEAGFVFNADVVELKLECKHGTFSVSLCAGVVEGRQTITSDTININSRLDLFRAQREHPDRPEFAMAAEIWDFFQPHMEHRWVHHDCSPCWSLEAKRIF